MYRMKSQSKRRRYSECHRSAWLFFQSMMQDSWRHSIASDGTRAGITMWTRNHLTVGFQHFQVIVVSIEWTEILLLPIETEENQCVAVIDQVPNRDSLTRAEAAFECWFQSACMDLRRSVHENCPFSIQFCTSGNCRGLYWTDCPHSFHICEENEQDKVTEYSAESLRSPTMNGRTCWPSISFWDFDTWWSDIVGNWCPSVRVKGKSNIISILNWKMSVSHQLFFRNINILWRRRRETRARAAETRGKKKEMSGNNR